LAILLAWIATVQSLMLVSDAVTNAFTGFSGLVRAALPE